MTPAMLQQRAGIVSPAADHFRALQTACHFRAYYAARYFAMPLATQCQLFRSRIALSPGRRLLINITSSTSLDISPDEYFQLRRALRASPRQSAAANYRYFPATQRRASSRRAMGFIRATTARHAQATRYPWPPPYTARRRRCHAMPAWATPCPPKWRIARLTNAMKLAFIYFPSQ